MGKVLYMTKGETHAPPIRGILLSDFAIGSIVNIMENGTPAKFYVAQHNYETSLNGSGRTLLLRADIHSNRVYNPQSNYSNVFDSSDIASWLNGTYKASLDSDVQNAMGTTKFYCATSTNVSETSPTYQLGTLSKSVFLVSATELTGSYSDTTPQEGNKLTPADLIGTPLSGVSDYFWTRSLWAGSRQVVHIYKQVNPIASAGGNVSTECGVRPCFTLPATALFDKNTLLFKGVL